MLELIVRKNSKGINPSIIQKPVIPRAKIKPLCVDEILSKNILFDLTCNKIKIKFVKKEMARTPSNMIELGSKAPDFKLLIP